MSQIVIDEKNNTVSYIETQTTRIVSLIDFMESLSHNASVKFPFLPEKCKGIIANKDYSGFIVEQFPCTTSITLMTKYPANFIFNRIPYTKPLSFKIHLPFMYWFVNIKNNPPIIQKVYLSFASARISDKDSYLGSIVFPNVSFNNGLGAVCLGRLEIEGNPTFNDGVDRIISGIMVSNFNSDYFNADRLPNIIKRKYVEIMANHSKMISKETSSIIEKIKKDIENTSSEEIQSLLNSIPEEEYFLAINPYIQERNFFMSFKAWEELSKEKTLGEFLNGLEISNYYTYDNIVNKFKQRIESACGYTF